MLIAAILCLNILVKQNKVRHFLAYDKVLTQIVEVSLIFTRNLTRKQVAFVLTRKMGEFLLCTTSHMRNKNNMLATYTFP